MVDGLEERTLTHPEEVCSMALNIYGKPKPASSLYLVSGGDVYKCREAYRSEFYDKIPEEEAVFIAGIVSTVVSNHFGKDE